MNIPHMIPDGKIHRFDTSSPKAGWYVSYGKYGVYGDWVTGEKHIFKDSNLTYREEQQIKKDMKELRKKENQKKNNIAKICEKIWDRSSSVVNHPYLNEKQVPNYNLRCDVDHGILYIPMRDIKGKLWSLQKIDRGLNKRNFTGGRKQGTFHALQEINANTTKIYICEGYATAASVFMALAERACVLCAFDAHNIVDVVKAIRSTYPWINIIICSDNDQWKKDNTGYNIAQFCHLYYDCSVRVPKFSKPHGKPTDFNDLHCLEGVGAVYDQIMGEAR